jgi:hypothetical protein
LAEFVFVIKVGLVTQMNRNEGGANSGDMCQCDRKKEHVGAGLLGAVAQARRTVFGVIVGAVYDPHVLRGINEVRAVTDRAYKGTTRIRFVELG